MYRPLSLPPVRLLLAERNDYTRRVVRETLFVAGIRHLSVASDQVMAMSHAAAGYFDVAVFGWELATAGDAILLDALSALRDGRGDKVRLVALMAGATRAGVDRARQCGVRTIIVLPLSPASLVQRLNRILLTEEPTDDIDFREAAA
jgi:AmiR/NasT family two-component response regulator